MIVSHTYRFIFIKTRKTAGSSLEIALSRFTGDKDVITPLRGAGALPPQNQAVPSEMWRVKDRIKAAVGRPPRFSQHSPAWFTKRSLPAEVWNTYYKFAIERNSWEIAVSAYWWFRHKHERDLSFSDFVRSRDLAHYSNWHLYTIDDRIAVDEVIRYDKLTESLRDLSFRIGLPDVPDLPREKSGLRPPTPHQEMYDEESRRRVADVFRREIKTFGWTFD